MSGQEGRGGVVVEVEEQAMTALQRRFPGAHDQLTHSVLPSGQLYFPMLKALPVSGAAAEYAHATWTSKRLTEFARLHLFTRRGGSA